MRIALVACFALALANGPIGTLLRTKCSGQAAHPSELGG